ncbi:hypothetical protein RFI_27936 [Reticulomyxa filosa]|uniref:Uncharacterized protein n=1 Tax=Reticulomyxa filosa TaxID=46433 RepID=X6M7L5_RETFI|nr:hypothetical protein RFI_27936 [Reticulomyxa filosa]|eukprot:ETO09437.1 hypothetical protein RFI_27936 [Reticulomyxa filosa]
MEYRNAKNSVRLICGGLPSEILHRRVEQERSYLAWLNLAQAVRNYYQDAQHRNMANNFTFADIGELFRKKEERDFKFRCWDGMLECMEMLECIEPKLYSVLVSERSTYLNSILNHTCQSLQLQSHSKQNATDNKLFLICGQALVPSIVQTVFQRDLLDILEQTAAQSDHAKLL